MKKILSLVLAVIMLLSLAVSSSAITIIGSDKYTGDTPSLKDLLYCLYVYGEKPGNSNQVGGNISGNDWWYGKCRTCSGVAFYYNADGIVYWKCLKEACGEHGSSSPSIDRWWAGVCGECNGDAFYYVNGYTVFWRCVEENCGKKGSFNLDGTPVEPGVTLANRCGYCYSTALTFVASYIRDGKIYYAYYCQSCGKSSVRLVTGDDLDLEIGTSAKATRCDTTDCNRIAYYHHYTVGDSNIYLIYTCSEGHETKRVLNNYPWNGNYPTGAYQISVVSNYGGTYSVLGGKYADYNELKTVKITPKTGYVIEDVEINGKSVGSTSTVTFRVKSNTVIKVTFAKAEVSTQKYLITTASVGNGTITAKKNNISVDASKVGAGYTDKITYTFTPAEGYEVASVKVDGKNIGNVSGYTFTKVIADHKIEVTFAWKSPYKDVSEKYAAAVEYVTKSGIMTYYGNKNTFNGTIKVTVQDFALALAEMVDTVNALDNDVDRLKWALKYDLVDAKENLDTVCSVQRACEMVDVYLEVLEEMNDVDFTRFDSEASVKDNAVNIKMVTASIYDKNRDLTRYDLAAVCRLIANLKYE